MEATWHLLLSGVPIMSVITYTRSLQLALAVFRRDLNHQLAQLRAIVHILEQAVDVLDVVDTLHRP